MSISAQLIGTCCCDDGTPVASCIGTAQIGSCFGLVTDPDCGILPTIGEFQVLTQQAPAYTRSEICGTISGTCTFTFSSVAAAPRQATYQLSGDVDALPPCHWIWYSKARSIAFDLRFPSTNRCCCMSVYYLYACENTNTVPCTTPVECFCDLYSSSHGNVTDSICVGNGTGCASVGTYDYERDGGGAVIPPGEGGSGGNWFTTKYPAATSAEEAQDDFASSPAVLERTHAGLSKYQDRVTENAYWWTWEVYHFNDGLPVKIGGASYPYMRADGSAGTAQKFRGSDPSVTTEDATGGHPLGRYLHAFAHPEYSYRKIVDFGVGAGTSANLWQMTTPYKFHYVADGLPVFSFEFDSEQREWFYPPEQYQITPDVSDAGFRQDCDDIDALFKGAFATRMTAKDWRGEVWADLTTLVTWGNAQSPAWEVPAEVMGGFGDEIAGLKMMFPCRLPGDLWDVRAIDPTTGDPTSVRPPALARVSASGDTLWTNVYRDSVTGDRTGQVDSLIYDMAEPPGGIASMPSAEQAAFKRLTRSVYFRTMPAGWDWSVAAAESDATRKPRYAWLLSRQMGDCNQNEALRWTCARTSTPCAFDNVWCTNGLPQVTSSGSSCPVGTVCLDNVCDLYYGHGGYDGNVNACIGRGEPSHHNPGGVGTCCVPTTMTHHGSSTPTHATSNLCFFRHAARTYAWDTTTTPFSLVLVSTLSPPVHPIDGAATCVPFPAISTQNDAGGGPAAFCGHLSDAGCIANCGGSACSEFSYAVIAPDCDGDDRCNETITLAESVSRPRGSIAGQRNAPYVGYSTCIETTAQEMDSCICPGDCSVMIPVVIPTSPPE